MKEKFWNGIEHKTKKHFISAKLVFSPIHFPIIFDLSDLLGIKSLWKHVPFSGIPFWKKLSVFFYILVQRKCLLSTGYCCPLNLGIPAFLQEVLRMQFEVPWLCHTLCRFIKEGFILHTGFSPCSVIYMGRDRQTDWCFWSCGVPNSEESQSWWMASQKCQHRSN